MLLYLGEKAGVFFREFAVANSYNDIFLALIAGGRG
jgi:hypothetical protein